VTDYQYDPLMRLKSITASDPGKNARMTRDYTYSPTGNIVSKNTEHGAYTYDYDSLNRLTEALNPQGPDEAYTYDALGNRLSSANHTDWTYNASNELQGYGDVTFAYDANGNTVQKASGLQTQNYTYDVEDRLVEVEDALNNTVAQYYYDPFGRRLWKDVDGARTYYVYSDEGLIGEYDNTGTQLRSYGWAPQSQWSTDPLFVKQDNTYYWYLNDHLGTPQQIIDTSGKVVWSGVYDSFGNCQIQTADILNNLRFAGQYHDAETGLYYNLNRYYDPVTGRYLRTDPFGEGLNLYVYVFNNPNSLIDPLGLCVVHPLLAGLGMIPIVGNIPDLIDAAWYLLEGNEAEAAIAAAAAIPIAGLVARGGQYVYKFGKWLIRSEKVKDFLQNGWKIVKNQIGSIGDINSLKNTSKKVDINLKYKEGWSDVQRAAADKKVKALTQADTRVVKSPQRSGTTQSRYRKDTGLDSSMDADHTVDLQVGGADDLSNISGLDKSVNRSMGSQIQQKIKDLPEGTELDKFTID